MLAVYLAWQLVRCGWTLALDGVVGVVELAVVPVIAAGGVRAGVAAGYLLVFLMLLFLVTGIVLWYQHRDRARGDDPVLVLVAIGSAIVGNRMRAGRWATQQNIPLQFAVLIVGCASVSSAAVAIALALGMAQTGASRAGHRWGSTWRSRGSRGAGGGDSAWGRSTRWWHCRPAPMTGSRKPASTLDSWAFMSEGQMSNDANGMPVQPYPIAGDLAAVEWIRENIDGLPVILEAPGNPGTWGGRISAFTGLPTVLGSPDVQRQQRPGMEREVDWRLADISAIYGSTGSYQDIVPWWSATMCEYIVVGQLEQVTYGAGSLAKFDQAVQIGLLASGLAG